jgi:hypothetical protein
VAYVPYRNSKLTRCDRERRLRWPCPWVLAALPGRLTRPTRRLGPSLASGMLAMRGAASIEPSRSQQ